MLGFADSWADRSPWRPDLPRQTRAAARATRPSSSRCGRRCGGRGARVRWPSAWQRRSRRTCRRRWWMAGGQASVQFVLPSREQDGSCACSSRRATPTIAEATGPEDARSLPAAGAGRAAERAVEPARGDGGGEPVGVGSWIAVPSRAAGREGRAESVAGARWSSSVTPIERGGAMPLDWSMVSRTIRGRRGGPDRSPAGSSCTWLGPTRRRSTSSRRYGARCWSESNLEKGVELIEEGTISRDPGLFVEDYMLYVANKRATSVAHILRDLGFLDLTETFSIRC